MCIVCFSHYSICSPVVPTLSTFVGGVRKNKNWIFYKRSPTSKRSIPPAAVMVPKTLPTPDTGTFGVGAAVGVGVASNVVVAGVGVGASSETSSSGVGVGVGHEQDV